LYGSVQLNEIVVASAEISVIYVGAFGTAAGVIANDEDKGPSP
jgi:hypothetical protein